MTARERLYVQALEQAARGRIADSVATYETVLAHHPTDLLAQRLSQMELFWIGEMLWSAEISGRVTTAWNGGVASYAVHLACRAFDLEETRHFDEAERLGREAVEMDPSEVWGAHAVAHVLFMQGRHDEGVAWLDGLKDHWSDANQMQFHLWWHRCLFHLERGEFDHALRIYDERVRNRELPLVKAMPDLYIDMQNGASMLLRLELRGVPVGNRWDELAELTLARLEDHTSPFTSAHYAAILAASGRFAEAGQLLQTKREFAAPDEGTLGPRYSIAAIPAEEAAIAHR
jgi:tetratricopeptide (TPR) repeat protein